jgi:cytochrome P450
MLARNAAWLNRGFILAPRRDVILPSVSLPPGPKSSALAQTLRWGLRPLAFMQEAREKYGDNFTVKFLTLERGMVMISDPAAVKALYTERSHGLPPGRDTLFTPIVGPRSLFVTSGADHLAHRKLMLPPFHGERMRSYQPLVEEIVDREIDSWPLGEKFAIRPGMQAITASAPPSPSLRCGSSCARC